LEKNENSAWEPNALGRRTYRLALKDPSTSLGISPRGSNAAKSAQLVERYTDEISRLSREKVVKTMSRR
jgi:hypothetical protein